MTQTLMIDWFQTLDPQVKPYWAIAIVMSVIFIIQMINITLITMAIAQ